MTLDTVFSVTALIGGTVLAFQFVLMLMGLGGDGSDLAGHHGADVTGGDHFGGAHAGTTHVGGADVPGGDVTGDHPSWQEAADADLGHPQAPWFYEMLSLRTLSAALTIFGLAGLTASAYGQPPMQAVVIATLAGLAAMYIVYWLFKQVYKLQHTGTENIRNAVGLEATVYVPIPAKRAGAGKVMFRLQNRLVEYQAVTEDDGRLATGEKVVIAAVVSSDTVRVRRARTPATDNSASVANVATNACSNAPPITQVN
jgi:hypothetical protein